MAIKLRVDIERIKELQNELAAFNKLDISRIQFFENDVAVEITPQLLEDWRFVGLSNTSFVMMEIYKKERKCVILGAS